MPHPEIERLLRELPGQAVLRTALSGPELDEGGRLAAAAAAGYAIPQAALPELEAALAQLQAELGDAALDQVQGGHWPVRNYTSPYD